jgi:hypothetical protein
MKKKIPDFIDLQGIVPICWAEVSKRNSLHCRMKFFDLSKGKADPPFRYLVITTDQYPGFDEHYLVCYFDVEGNWITQSARDTLEEAFTYCEYVFRVRPEQWYEAP